MHITFGPALDGFVPLDPQPTGEAAVCGPVGLLHLLELRLGLPSQPAGHGRRVAAYRDALSAHAEEAGPQFYSASFGQDDYAVAATLLRWRDELVIAGWDGQVVPEAGARLAVLAAIEATAPAIVRRGEGDRLRAIVEQLAWRSPQLTELVLTEPLTALPARWRGLVGKLPTRGQPADEVLASGLAPEVSDLGRLQRWARGGAAPVFSGDGSLVVVRSHSEATLAHAAAHWCATASDPAVIVDGGQLALLDGALAQLDRPVAGAASASVERAIPQVLPLALRLLWEPLDPQHLLEFIMHPVCPVTSRLRHRLAEALREAPGIGGPAWMEAVKRASASAEKADKPQVERQRIEDDLATWILAERHPAEDGAPGTAVAERARQVAAWAGRRAGAATTDSQTAALFRALAATARELADLAALRADLQPAQLDRLLRLVVGSGWEGSAQPAELGHLPVRRAAACVEPVDTVFWWNAAGQSAAGESPWTPAERTALAKASVELLPDAKRLATVARWERRPLLAARRRLVLFQALQRAGEPVPEPPLVTRMRALPREAGVAQLFREVDREALAPVATAPLAWAALTVRALPRPRRWWHLPADVRVPLRATESFTSLDKLVLNPVDYVLEHGAGLAAGPLADASVIPDHRLFGNLVHRLAEHLFDRSAKLDWRTAKEPELAAWLTDEWATLLPLEGATLLLPGRQSARAQLQATAERALGSLLTMLRQVRAVRVTADYRPAEREFVGQSDGTPVKLRGNLDLLVETAAGGRLVFDLKWGGDRKRRAELKQGRALQLAIYAQLVSGAGAMPPGAFLILRKNLWLTDAPGLLPGVREIKPEHGGGTAACWEQFKQVYQWRAGQLAAGWIEAPATGVQADPADSPPEPAPPHQNWAPGPGDDVGKYSPYGALLGWEADQ